MLPEPIPAIVLAGGRDRGPLAEATGQNIRGLLPLRGRPMASYVLDALDASSSVGPVVVVGPAALAPALSGAALLEEGPDLLSNILLGLEAHATEGPVLLLTVDLPFLTPESLDDFITRSVESGADLTYPIIHQTHNAARFPTMKRTYARLREGRFTGGNMMCVRASFFRQMQPLVSEAYGLRKKPLQLARRVGWGMLARLLIGRLQIAHVEGRVGGILNGNVRAIVTDYAEIGADVDKPEDLEIAEMLLG